MIAILNETRLWYCDICEKTIIIEIKSKYIFSKSQKYKNENGTVIKEYEFINPDIVEVTYIFNDTIKNCRKKYY